MKKPKLALVPPLPKGPSGEPQSIPFCGELEPFDPTKGLVLIERKAPYFTVIRSTYPGTTSLNSSTDKEA